jgi:hypothetical protein
LVYITQDLQFLHARWFRVSDAIASASRGFSFVA